jgi:hypothetical protein
MAYDFLYGMLTLGPFLETLTIFSIFIWAPLNIFWELYDNTAIETDATGTLLPLRFETAPIAILTDNIELFKRIRDKASFLRFFLIIFGLDALIILVTSFNSRLIPDSYRALFIGQLVINAFLLICFLTWFLLNDYRISKNLERFMYRPGQSFGLFCLALSSIGLLASFGPDGFVLKISLLSVSIASVISATLFIGIGAIVKRLNKWTLEYFVSRSLNLKHYTPIMIGYLVVTGIATYCNASTSLEGRIAYSQYVPNAFFLVSIVGLTLWATLNLTVTYKTRRTESCGNHAEP